jgi:hypothetical protein
VSARTTLLLAGLLVAIAPATLAGQTAAALSVEQKRAFLLNAEVKASRPVGKGVTGSLRLTLSDGTLTHDAGFQSIDDRTSVADRARGRRRAGELHFVDSYKYNIAAYEIARLLGLDQMMPVTVERRIDGRPGSLTWWVDDVLMDEAEREKSNAQPTNPVALARQRQRMTIFAELVRDVDRNKGNVLYTKDWRVIMIDFTRAFRLDRELRYPETLQTCDRALYEALRTVPDADVRRVAGSYLTRRELEALLARRKLIVDRFDRLIRDRGEGVVLHVTGM